MMNAQLLDAQQVRWCQGPSSKGGVKNMTTFHGAREALSECEGIDKISVCSAKMISLK